MREIRSIVLHHSVSNWDLQKTETVELFNIEHKIKFYDKYIREGLGNEQPISEMENGSRSCIAYHYLIFKDGTVYQTRQHKDIGYHAGDIQVNRESIAICYIGNFEIDTPTYFQHQAGAKLIQVLKRQYPTITEIGIHKDYKATLCPGKNFDFNRLKDMLKELETPEEVVESTIVKVNRFEEYLEVEKEKGYNPVFKKHTGDDTLTEGEIRTLMEIGFARLLLPKEN